ncbi:hypothetical protein BDF20DRAFT_913074 [Mycotypha africana]|uniref:uncharacterized protein n=1 Tax=Mycotypha africana TaxID=64632 RepID=UPI002300C09F|nr:uncharacterized protein BDF20DRAFT_913074 [Mycotypha africana]KAI8979509.1 hypothetical protein BDF20DRAFT_913074 [Mycotypha africana]
MPFLLKFISTIRHESLLESMDDVEKLDVIRIGPPFENIGNQMKKYYQHVVAINSSNTTDFTGVKKGVSPGDMIDFVGPNYIVADDIKASILAHMTLASPPALSVNTASTDPAEETDYAQQHHGYDMHVLYLHQSTRRNFGTTRMLLELQNKESRFHLLRIDKNTIDIQQEIIDRLEAWLELHMQYRVLWVICDNFSSKTSTNVSSSSLSLTQQFSIIDRSNSNPKSDSFYFEELKRLQKKWGFVVVLNSAHSQQEINIDFRFQFLSERELQMIWPVHMDKFKLIADENGISVE